MSKSVYEMVTERIIEELEKGSTPWERTWRGTRSGAYNFVTKRSYSLMNQMMLKHRGAYGTFKQWTEKGGKIRKGEKSEIVVFWKFQIIEEENEKTGEKEEKKIPMLRYYNVFHISQVDGVELKEEELPEVEPIESAEKIKRDYVEREHIKILEYATDEAFYSPAGDFIQVPERGQYKDVNEFIKELNIDVKGQLNIKLFANMKREVSIVEKDGDRLYVSYDKVKYFEKEESNSVYEEMLEIEDWKNPNTTNVDYDYDRHLIKVNNLISNAQLPIELTKDSKYFRGYTVLNNR